MNLWQITQIIITGLATTELIRPGIIISVVFGALILGVVKNSSLRGKLFSYAVLKLTFSEATGLFTFMMAFWSIYQTDHY